MKVKELKRTVNVSWSPAEAQQVLLATGSAAQQLDATFSTSAQLELYSLNLNDPSYDMELKSSLPSSHKFQKIVWSGAGVLVGGCDGGLLNFYDVDRLMKGASDALVGSSNKHNGNVSALDVNPFQSNLLSSGASDSEIYIWDLNNTSAPMAPGNKSQPSDHVQDLAWNQQVQHILASTFATRCVVWDLRKNEPIMKLSDAQSRTRWRSVAWHPAVATQLCVASEDDQVPVIQLWDLRLAASPLVTLERHQKGVMALSWCRQDPDLLLSAGKDGTVLCWNPNNTTPGGELLSEISSEGQWVFDVAWCPRNPCLVASASFDGHVNIHCVNGGTKPNVFNSRSNIMDSFPGVDSLHGMPTVAPQPAGDVAVRQLLPRPPRWTKRPTRAKFAFGGKLVSFENDATEANPHRLVYISQVVSDPEFMERATQLEEALGDNAEQGPDAAYRLAEYCRQRGDAATDQHERYTWFFLKANFEPNFRTEVLNLLGYKQDEITSKSKSSLLTAGDFENNIESLTSGIAGLSRGESTETEAEFSTDTSTDLSDANTLKERKLINTEFTKTAQNVAIPTGDDSAGLICRALVCGNLEQAVELCLEAKRVSDALIIASLGSQELLNRVQKYYLSSTSSDPVSLLSRTLLLSEWRTLVGDTSARSWRETLATVVTHCDDDSLAANCELLGSRLSSESDPAAADAATLCYVCSASADVLVEAWRRRADSAGGAGLARLVELALVARRAALVRNRPVQAGGALERVLTEYAARLAADGRLEGALRVLGGAANTELRERLTYALQPARRPQQQNNSWSSYSNRTRSNSGQYAQKRSNAPTVNNHINDSYNSAPPPVVNQPWPSHPAAAPPQPAYGAPPPPQQPPRPGSVGPHSGPHSGPHAGGASSRSKYLVDPSVKSGPAYGQYNYNNVSQPALSQGYSNYNSGPVPANFNAASVPNPVPSSGLNSPIPGLSNPGYMGQGATNAAPANQGLANGGYYNPNQFAPEPKPAAPVAPPVVTSAAPGWNDPPMLSSAPKSQTEMSALHAGTRQWSQIIEHRKHPDEPKTEVPAPAPITHPLFGVEPQHVPLSPAYQGAQQGYPGAQPGYPGAQQAYPGAQQGYPPPQQGYNSAQQAYPGAQYPSGQPDQYASQMSPGGYQQVEAAVAAVPEPAPKRPLPEEHIHLQTVLDALRAACARQAQNPQMKRKLDDVQKRLETLYDLLREYRLSENALSVLHAAAQQAQGGDYAGALAALTSLASGPDFAAVASFLPGLKVLLQVATQAQVYLR